MSDPSSTKSPSHARWGIALGIMLVVIAGVAFAMRGGSHVQYFTAPVTHGDIHDVVDATGTVNAVTTVQVGSQVSGRIATLHADFNSRVHKGEVIALIDPALLRAAVQQATADLESANANVTAADADLEKARAALAQAKSDYDRYVPLVARDFITQQTLTDMKGTYDVAKATVDGAAAAAAQARAQVKLKEAAVAVAHTNLDYSIIRSPIDGTVVARNVDVGQTVAASLQAPTIFTIAQDLTKMQLYAATDESDVGRVRLGQTVTFKVDAFPKETFRGVVSQIRMNATTVQNVVTYSTIIDFANPELKLFPGMTAYVTVPVADVRNAVRIPNSALRYRPPLNARDIERLYAHVGIDEHAINRSTATGGDTTPTPRAVGDRDVAPKPRTAPAAENAIVWKHTTSGAIEPAELALGITDHAYTEVVAVVKGTLAAGDEVITGSVVPGASTSSRR